MPSMRPDAMNGTVAVAVGDLSERSLSTVGEAIKKQIIQIHGTRYNVTNRHHNISLQSDLSY